MTEQEEREWKKDKKGQSDIENEMLRKRKRK